MPVPKPFAAWLDRATVRRAAGGEWPVTLDRHQVFILPTRFGWLAALATIAMLLVALNYQNSPVFLLAFLFGALMLVAMVACHRHLRGLTIRTARTRPVFAGEPIPFLIGIANRETRTRRGIACYAGSIIGTETTIAPGGEAELALTLPPHKRGRHRIAGAGLASSEPFGVFRAWSRIAPVECIVYPRPTPNAPPPPGVAAAARHGEREDTIEDFVALARYRPGDRPSQIAWPAYARSDVLERKTFGGDGGATSRLDFANAPGADVEAKLSVLASWALAAARNNARWELVLPGHTVAPGRGPAHLDRALRALALCPGPYDDEN
ncbi:MAG: DUF58 domain-containing protein [Gammaproteobacteria bacterium]